MSTDTDTTQASWELPEAVWQRMGPLISPRKSKEGRPQTVDLKRITEGIFYVLRTGIQWQACPRERFAQHRVLLLPAVGHSRGVWAVVGRGADRL
jgi:transposase